MLRSAADLELPIVAVTLAHQKGLFPAASRCGWQISPRNPIRGTPRGETVLQPVEGAFSIVTIEGRTTSIAPCMAL